MVDDKVLYMGSPLGKTTKKDATSHLGTVPMVNWGPQMEKQQSTPSCRNGSTQMAHPDVVVVFLFLQKKTLRIFSSG